MSQTKAELLADSFGSNATGTIPIGGIIMWSGTVAPTGWVLCDNSAAAQAANAPDLRNRFIVGAGNNYAVGNFGGADTVTLTLDQIPAHNHFDSNTSGVPGPTGAGGGPSQWGFDVDGNDDLNRVLTDDGPPFDGLVGDLSRGGGQAHENRPPYYALAFIMRVS